MAMKIPGVLSVGVRTPTELPRIAGYEPGLAQAAEIKVGEAGERAGQQAFQTGGVIQDAQDDIQYANGIKNVMNTKLNADMAARTATDPTTIVQNYRKTMDDATNAAAANIVTPMARARFEGAIKFLTNGGVDTAMNIAQQKTQGQNRAYTQSALFDKGGLVDQMVQAPDDTTRSVVVNWGKTLLDGQLKAGNITPAEHAEWGSQVPEAYGRAKAAQMIDTDPRAAAVVFHAGVQGEGPLAQYLRPTELMQFEGRARALAKQQDQQNMIENRASVDLKVQNALAEIADTGSASNPPSTAELASAYKPAEANRIVSSLHLAASTFNTQKSMALTSPAEDMQLYTASRPQPGDPDYAAKDAAANLIAQTAQQKQTEVAADTAGYLVKNSPQIANAMKAAINDPKAMPAYISMIDAGAKTLGVDRQPDVLPKNAAVGLVQNILSAPPEQRVAQFKQLASQYDNQSWPRVFSSLVHAGLPPGYQVLAAAVGLPAQTALATTLPMGEKAASEAIVAQDATSIKRGIDVDPDLQRLGASMRNDPATFANIKQQITLMAFGLRAQGLTNDQAISTATASVSTAKYDFLDNGGARVPKGMLDTATYAARRAITDLTTADLKPAGSAGGHDLNPVQQQQLNDQLRSAQNGYWVTNESDTGIVRYYANGMPVMTAGGKRLELMFKDMKPLEAPPGQMSPSQQQQSPAIPGIGMPVPGISP